MLFPFAFGLLLAGGDPSVDLGVITCGVLAIGANTVGQQIFDARHTGGVVEGRITQGLVPAALDLRDGKALDEEGMGDPRHLASDRVVVDLFAQAEAGCA